MDGDGEQSPRQSPGENQAEVAPRAHEAHDCHPADALVEEILQGLEIGDGFDDVREQLDAVALLGNQAADQQIVCGTIFDFLVTAETFDGFSAREDGLAESEFHAVKLPGDHDAGKEIRNHSDGLKLLKERGFLGGKIEAGAAADLGIAERSDNGAEIIGADADVAVGDDEEMVARFLRKADEAGDFVVNGVAARAVENADLAIGEFDGQFFQERERGIIFVDAKQNFVIGIILAAEAGVIFVGVGVEALDGFQATDGRSEIGAFADGLRGLRGKMGGAENREKVIDEGDGGKKQENVFSKLPNLRTSRRANPGPNSADIHSTCARAATAGGKHLPAVFFTMR